MDKRLKKAKILLTCKVLDNPNFLLSKHQITQYDTKYKTLNHGTFYKYVRKSINVLSDSKTYDEDNRNKIPFGLTIPAMKCMDHSDNAYVQEAIKYVDRHFHQNIGYGYDHHMIYPIDHKTSKLWLRDFIRNKFDKFGTYQDAILRNHNFIFHSIISPMMNIGLLNPKFVIDEIMKYYNSHKSEISINNLEGFIRQIAGWREYQRYIYHTNYDKIKQSNGFNHTNKNAGQLVQWYHRNTTCR